MARGGTRGQVGDIALWAVPAGLIGARAVARRDRPRRCTSARAATRSRPWRSGTAGSGSGVRSRAACSAPGSTAGATGSCCARSPTPWPRACCWPRRSAASATTSTRSSSAGPPTCPWGLEIDLAHRPERLRAVRHLPPHVPLRGAVEPRGDRAAAVADRRFRLGYGRVFALYVMLYTAGPRLDRVPADRPGRAPGRRRPAVQRVDLDRAVRAGGGVLRGDRPAAPPARTPASPRRTSRTRSPPSRDRDCSADRRPGRVRAARGRATRRRSTVRGSDPRIGKSVS